jgi:two-component system cell cycle response regulator DivK
MPDPKEATVLIVEDNSDNLFVALQLLRSEVGVRCVNGCASGRQFFDLLAASPTLTPDLICLDIQLPQEDGYAILKQIRAHPRLSQTRVIALTANVLPQDVERARQAGFDGFIGKPIVFKRFPTQARRILNGESVWEPR